MPCAPPLPPRTAERRLAAPGLRLREEVHVTPLPAARRGGGGGARAGRACTRRSILAEAAWRRWRSERSAARSALERNVGPGPLLSPSRPAIDASHARISDIRHSRPGAAVARRILDPSIWGGSVEVSSAEPPGCAEGRHNGRACLIMWRERKLWTPMLAVKPGSWQGGRPDSRPGSVHARTLQVREVTLGPKSPLRPKQTRGSSTSEFGRKAQRGALGRKTHLWRGHDKSASQLLRHYDKRVGSDMGLRLSTLRGLSASTRPGGVVVGSVSALRGSCVATTGALPAHRRAILRTRSTHSPAKLGFTS